MATTDPRRTGIADANEATERRRLTASRLLACYAEEQAISAQLGAPRMLSRGAIPAADIPILSRVPDAASDAGAAILNIEPWPGALAPNFNDESVRRAGKQWYRGFNPGMLPSTSSLNGRFGRLPASVAAFGSNGNQGQDANTWGVDGGASIAMRSSVVLDGPRLYLLVNNGVRFRLFVNDRIVTNADLTTDAPGSVLFDGADNTYRITGGGNDWLKIRFATSGRRKISFENAPNQGLPVRMTIIATSTLTPYTLDPIRWMHIGDSFSSSTGASQGFLGLNEFLPSAFGMDNLDFVNAAQGGTSNVSGQDGPTTLLTAGVASTAAPTTNIKMTQRYAFEYAGRLCWQDRGADIVTLLVGHNDGSAPNRVALHTRFLGEILAAYPNAIVAVFTANASPGTLPSGAIPSENDWVSAAVATGCIPVRLQAAGDGPFLRGTGRVGATTGNGNADLYVSTDATHPSDAGHRAYGELMARRLASVLATSV